MLTLEERAARIAKYYDTALKGNHRLGQACHLAGLELIEAKALVPHGQWETWCATIKPLLNGGAPIGMRRIQQLMALAREDDPEAAREVELVARKERRRKVKSATVIALLPSELFETGLSSWLACFRLWTTAQRGAACAALEGELK